MSLTRGSPLIVPETCGPRLPGTVMDLGFRFCGPKDGNPFLCNGCPLQVNLMQVLKCNECRNGRVIHSPAALQLQLLQPGESFHTFQPRGGDIHCANRGKPRP